MKRSISLSLTAVVTVATAALAPMAVNAAPDRGTTALQVLTESSRVGQPHSVRIERSNGGLRVTGTLRKRFQTRRRDMGHVDVEFLDGSGEVISTKHGRSWPTGWNKNQKRRRFSVVVDELPAGSHAVRVRHNPGADADSKPC